MRGEGTGDDVRDFSAGEEVDCARRKVAVVGRWYG